MTNQTKLIDPRALDRAAADAADLLKVLSNPARLRLLCALLPGARRVGDLEEQLGASQSYVSGQLARMRAEGLVAADRDGRIVRYRLADPRLGPILQTLYDVFCPADDPDGLSDRCTEAAGRAGFAPSP